MSVTKDNISSLANVQKQINTIYDDVNTAQGSISIEYYQQLTSEEQLQFIIENLGIKDLIVVISTKKQIRIPID